MEMSQLVSYDFSQEGRLRGAIVVGLGYCSSGTEYADEGWYHSVPVSCVKICRFGADENRFLNYCICSGFKSLLEKVA